MRFGWMSHMATGIEHHFSDDILQRNSELMKISSCSHPNSNKVITTKLCIFRSRGRNGLIHSSMVTHISVSGMGHHWFRQWLVTCSAPCHCLSQCWFFVNQSLCTNFSDNFHENDKKNHPWKYNLKYRLQNGWNFAQLLGYCLNAVSVECWGPFRMHCLGLLRKPPGSVWYRKSIRNPQ